MTRRWVPWLLTVLASVTSISVHLDAQGLRIELKRAQQQLAAAQDQFELASVCEQE